MHRRILITAMLGTAASLRFSVAAAQSADAARVSAFLEALRPDALAKGVSAATFNQAVAGLAYDPAIAPLTTKQSEFSKPIKAYVETAASPSRVERGRRIATAEASALQAIEGKFGVPREIIIAILGMETDFGADMGNRDILRSLVTLAILKPAPAQRDEVIAALLMLEKGAATRARLKGSWAGAMGYPQFLPSAYWKYAVSHAGGAPADIFSSLPDACASIANFLRQSGWAPGRSWGEEVRLPRDFGFTALRADYAAFAKSGVVRADGQRMPANGAAVLYLPVGVAGPAFLLDNNFFVLKAYNFSDSYAMSVAFLADRIAGRVPVRANWPDEAKPLDQAQRVSLQTLLRTLGFYRGEVDGRFGPLTRDAVHAFQRANNVTPSDGHPSINLLDRLEAEALKRGVR